VWWHTIVSPTGREKTGYPTQKPEGLLRRMIAASTKPGDRVLDFFAGSGTTGAVARALGRRFVLVDENPEAIAVIRGRLGDRGITYRAVSARVSRAASD
jgi:site-specific DNA-methyltransferase (adenine-specific)